MYFLVHVKLTDALAILSPQVYLPNKPNGLSTRCRNRSLRVHATHKEKEEFLRRYDPSWTPSNPYW